MKLDFDIFFFQVLSRKSTDLEVLIYFNLYQSCVFTLDSDKYNTKGWKDVLIDI